MEGRFLTEGGALRHFKQTMTAAAMRPTAAHTDAIVTAMFPSLSPFFFNVFLFPIR